jgi:hypothetical protein
LRNISDTAAEEKGVGDGLEKVRKLLKKKQINKK